MNKSNTPSNQNRSKISTAHNWKTEINSNKSFLNPDSYDAKKMQQLQHRSELDS